MHPTEIMKRVVNDTCRLPGNKAIVVLVFIFLTLTFGVGCAVHGRGSPPGHESWEGLASWYGPGFHGRRTASGEVFDMYDYTAAHSFLPFNTKVRVTNLSNHRSVVVRINDRGPHTKHRIIDLSYQAAKKIGLLEMGTARVRIEIVK